MLALRTAVAGTTGATMAGMVAAVCPRLGSVLLPRSLMSRGSHERPGVLTACRANPSANISHVPERQHPFGLEKLSHLSKQTTWHPSLTPTVRVAKTAKGQILLIHMHLTSSGSIKCTATFG